MPNMPMFPIKPKAQKGKVLMFKVFQILYYETLRIAAQPTR